MTEALAVSMFGLNAWACALRELVAHKGLDAGAKPMSLNKNLNDNADAQDTRRDLHPQICCPVSFPPRIRYCPGGRRCAAAAGRQ